MRLLVPSPHPSTGAAAAEADDAALLEDAERQADRGDPLRALATADGVLVRARARADDATVLAALLVVSLAARAAADLPRALAASDEAQERAGPAPGAARVSAALCRGHVFLQLGDYPRALDAVALARASMPVPPGRGLRVRCLQLAAMIAARLSDHEAAEATFTEALAVAGQEGDVQAMALLHNNLGVLHLKLGQPDPDRRGDGVRHLQQALAAFDASKAQARLAGDSRLLMMLEGNIAGALGDLGRLDEARDAFRRQLAAAREQNDRHNELLALVNLGEALWRLADHGPALATLHEALAMAEEAGVAARRIGAHRQLAAAYEAAGDPGRALAHYKAFHALDRAAYASDARGAVRTLALQGEIERVQREADLLRREQARLADANAVLARTANEDPLTGLCNRRGLAETLRDASTRAEPVALAVFDLDRFKYINDRHSHAVGDGVLRAFAGLLRDACRGSDLAVRLGGEEFVLLLRGASIEQAVAVAERVRAALAFRRWDDIAPGLKVTVSAGVAAGPPPDVEALLADADRALYRAKRGGRNRVMASDPGRA